MLLEVEDCSRILSQAQIFGIYVSSYFEMLERDQHLECCLIA